MERTVCEQALGRVLFYIQDCGLAVTRAQCCQAMSLVKESLEADTEADVYARVLELIPRYFDVPEPNVPLLQPPIRRGSVGYHPDE